MNQLKNCQARYRSNTWMGRTRTDGPDEFEPPKFDCTSNFLNFLVKKIPVIFYAKGSFGKHLNNRHIPYQSVRDPSALMVISMAQATAAVCKAFKLC